MSQNDVRREKILSYNLCHDINPLVFKTIGGSFVDIDSSELRLNRRSKTPNIKNLVRVILSYSQRYYSYNLVTMEHETGPERNRSAIDIWRHAIHIYPDITVFQIMKAVHSLCEDEEVFGQYCHQIKRAVFRSHNVKFTNMSFQCHEYSISFNTWKGLLDD